MALKPRLAAVLAVVVLLAACGGGDEEEARGPEGPVSELTITSTDLSYDITAFEVAAGEPVTLTYDNSHDGIPHNVHLKTGGDDEPMTPLEKGPVEQELTFTLDEPGEVEYVCDIHASQMRGTITVR